MENKILQIKFFALPLIAVLLVLNCSSPSDYRHPKPASIDTNVVLPPAWAFGLLYGAYTNQEQSIERIKQIKKHDYPIDAYWIDSWFWSFDDQGEGPDKYLDFVADTIGFPDRKAMWDFMEQNNIKGGFWTWDAIQKTGNEAAFEDFESKGYFRGVYMNTNSWHNKGTSTAMFQEGGNKEGTPTGNIDFDNPEAAAYFKKRMKHFFDEGADFIKLDRTVHIPTVRTMFEMSQEFGKETKGRGFMLSHAGSPKDPEYKKYPAKWTSDTRTDWTIEKPNKKFNSWVPKVAFKENIAMYTDTARASSEIPFLTNDTGGFDRGLSEEMDEELYIRWLQFSMFGPITSVFSQPENQTSNMAWNYSERADRLFRQYAHLRMQMFPYLYSYAHKTRLEGKNMVRKFDDHKYQFMLGNEVLVAPVYEQGARSRAVHLPQGNWVNYWTGDIIAGGQTISAEAPIEQIPLFVRQGSIIPMRKYFSSIEAGNNDHLTLHVYPGDDSHFNLIEDDGLSNDYLNGIYAQTDINLNEEENATHISINPIKGGFEGMKKTRTWKLALHTQKEVASITVNGLEVAFEDTNGFVEVSGISAVKSRRNEIYIRYAE